MTILTKTKLEKDMKLDDDVCSQAIILTQNIANENGL